MNEMNNESTITAEELGLGEEVFEYEMQLRDARNDIIPFIQGVWVNLHQEWGDDAIHTQSIQQAIWKASTEMLPYLEVQVVIDANNRAHISSGSSGYVSFLKNPIGMKLPIRCWFHTHPFGAAYFSGTDWNTVSTWEPLMQTAYVIGGEDHYGFWSNTKPNQLEIKDHKDNWQTQIKNGSEEE